MPALVAAVRKGRWIRVPNWLLLLLQAFVRSRRDRIVGRAVIEAIRRFSSLEPYWRESLFDEPFIRRLDAGWLRHADPEQIARAWSRQFSYHDEGRRERDVQRATRAAQGFQLLLEETLSERLSVANASRHVSPYRHGND